MGDRANIAVKDSWGDGTVYLYGHWSGSTLPDTLQTALRKKWRWDDSAYLARIIFEQMIDQQEARGLETGFGLSATVGDGDDRVLFLDCDKQTITRNERTWTFEEYCDLSEEQLERVW